MGGSFDPIHVAHLIVAEAVREALSLDLVLFVPAGKQPLKRERAVSAAADRVAMVRLAIQDNPQFAISTVDVDRPGPSYTADTLEQLRAEWGTPERIAMWFIAGIDSLATFHQWHDPARILAQARLAVVNRPGATLNLSQLEAALPGLASSIDLVDAPLMAISSTDLRRRVAEGRSIRYRVPEAVRAYIEARGLYKW